MTAVAINLNNVRLQTGIEMLLKRMKNLFAQVTSRHLVFNSLFIYVL